MQVQNMGLNKQTTQINLNNKEILCLHPKLFENTPNLESLLLKNNKLKNFHKKAFSYVNGLQNLDVSLNMIEKLYFLKKTSHHLKSLRHLNLSSNSINRIGRKHFLNLKQLQIL